MSYRYTRNDVEASLIRFLHATRPKGDEGASILLSGKDRSLKELAARLKVDTTADYVTGQCIRWFVQKAPNGGFRPCVMGPGSTGERSPEWWPSAGLGPCALPAREAYNIIEAATKAPR